MNSIKALWPGDGKTGFQVGDLRGISSAEFDIAR
jgi:hypothetical protein